ncbi:hypothetical protein RFF05_07925 [Bengtsoniella intestinalis]|uniref:hypothetical protein n=1 Tax=Bengtsoniella intestinalis TaxID=3073143 RepID=UPI00391F370D
MYNDIRREVVHILENYSDTQRKISLLRYELEHPRQITADELIGALNFAHGEAGLPSAPGHISNKTMYIAMSYQETAAKETQELINAIAMRLYPLEREVSRLQHYMKLLTPSHQMIIELYYFQQRTWEEIAELKDMTPRTAQRLRQGAVAALSEMYAYVYKQEDEI